MTTCRGDPMTENEREESMTKDDEVVMNEVAMIAVTIVAMIGASEMIVNVEARGKTASSEVGEMSGEGLETTDVLDDETAMVITSSCELFSQL